jgi:hypothetical protein
MRVATAMMLALWATITASCHPARGVENPAVFEEDDPRAKGGPDDRLLAAEERATTRQKSSTRADTAVTQKPSAQVSRRGGKVERPALQRVLDRGIGTFLADVELAPHLDVRQHFVGWEIVRFSYPGVDLHPGDVVTAVNRRSLEKPDDAQKLWEDLRASDAIVVAGERDGVPFLLRYEVVEPSRKAP